MKKQFLIVLTLSVNVLTFCLVIMLSLLGYRVATITGSYSYNIWDYLPVPLIILILASFGIQLYVIFREDLKKYLKK